MKKYFCLTLLTAITIGCTTISNKKFETDQFLWLEDIEGQKSLDWVKAQNKISLDKATQSPIYKKLKSEALTLLEDKNKIPHISFRGNSVYNFWQDKIHIKGIWRRTNLRSYKSNTPQWETLLDIDHLSKTENKNWVLKGISCLSDKKNQCLITLSRGGKDASVTREFNIKTKQFVKNGFSLPEAKSWVHWRDKNSLYVATDFGKGTLTTSGYARIVKIWQRNTPLSSAKTIYTADATDMGASGFFLQDGKEKLHFVTKYITFYETKKWMYVGDKLIPLPIPDKVNIHILFKKHLILQIEEDWTIDGQTYKSGSLLALKTRIAINQEVTNNDIQLLFKPNSKSSIGQVGKTKNYLLIKVLENVKGKIYSTSFLGNKFLPFSLLNIKTDGDLSLGAFTDEKDLITYYEDDFLKPHSLNLYNLKTQFSSRLKSLSEKFNSTDMIAEQRWAKSKDGTKIPYYIMGKKEVLRNGNAPTELYGYGGFNISLNPSYQKLRGKLWMENGGVYVQANIRGGGEFGPNWHQSAILKNKHKSYEDFIAIAENLISTGVTSNKKLAIHGGSNGGLLVGAAMIKRPDLFAAVICSVPLLDMIRYSKLLAGASWMAEYGDPEIPEMRDYILTYSPYQNVQKDVIYPKIFFMTSTKDDRVHPGHARKMAAKMMEFEHKGISYYENIEGGHSASADLKQLARMKALVYDFLLTHLK